MHSTHRFRPLFAALALAALLLVPGSAAAAPRDPVTAFAAWLGGLWETLGLPTVGFVLDPNGGTPSAAGGTPADDPVTVDEGFVLDPNG